MSYFQEMLDSLDVADNPLDEKEIFCILLDYFKSHLKPGDNKEYGTESSAFNLQLTNNQPEGYYDCPEYVEEFQEQDILYWAARDVKVKHPVLKARYASLVWNFKKVLQDKTIALNMAKLAVDSILEMTSKRLHKCVYEQAELLKMALSISLGTKDDIRIRNCINTMLSYQKEVIS